MAKKSPQAKKAVSTKQTTDWGRGAGGRAVNRPIPSSSFEESEAFARAVYETGSGRPVRRITVFDQISKSPESSASRLLVTNSGKYGLIKGSYKAEMLEPSADAIQIFDERVSAKDRARARVKLAIENIPVLAALYEKLKELKLPPRAALLDLARDVGVPKEYLEEAVDTFLVNLRSVGLLKNLSGAERIVTIDHMLDAAPNNAPGSVAVAPSASTGSRLVAEEIGDADFDKTCFYVSPIGEEGSDLRRHSDLFLSHIVEPALSSFGLAVIRADRIAKPGIISRQIFDFIMKSRLVIVDLSHHNPNVFYELAVRHMIKKPVVQITRLLDKVPFDINQMRTIVIDDTDIYTLLPKLEIYKSEIATQVRRALENEGAADNPITAYYPSLEIKQM